MGEKGHFDKYKKSTDPEVRRRAADWGAGIGLQAVDGLHVSKLLIEIAKLHIEGKITMEDVDRLIAARYGKRKPMEPTYKIIKKKD